MKGRTVENLMIPLAEYATVSENATLKEAIEALEEAQKKVDKTKIAHRAILVFNDLNHIVGKISQLDILRALEPKYETIGDPRAIARHGFSQKFMRSMIDQYNLWETPLDKLSKKAATMKVKDFMYTPTEGEFVHQKASLNEAIHQLVMGHHQSLLVVSKKKIVGILRLVDVFKEISSSIK